MVVDGDFSTVILQVVQDLIIGTVRARIIMCVSSHDLLHVLLLNLGLLFAHLHVGYLCLDVFIDHSFGDLALHLEQFRVHSDRVHAVHDRLARHPVKAYLVVRTVIVLIVVKGAPGQIDTVLGECTSRLEVIRRGLVGGLWFRLVRVVALRPNLVIHRVCAWHGSGRVEVLLLLRV